MPVLVHSIYSGTDVEADEQITVPANIKEKKEWI